ncbi:DUF504 domain-containing protein [Sulfolobus sp. D5]|nr:DUF504 domain-containing protein [Sulfolobus sp. D5]
MNIRDAINRVIWKEKERISEYVLIIKDRISYTGISEIPFENIDKIDRNYIYLNDDTIIPMHRVLMIKRKTDCKVVWKRGDDKFSES